MYCRSQFGYLDQMQIDLRAGYPDLDIEIVGVNDRGTGSILGNEGMTEGRDLPWLQDVENSSDGQSVWEAWEVTERDVMILDANNVMAGLYNLTENDLEDPVNYGELQDLFVEIASSQTDPSSLSGHVYFDVSNDGIKDSVESPIGNVEITLTGVNHQGQSVNQTILTEANGAYAFFGLGPGTYTISQTQPVFVLDGQETIGSAGGMVDAGQFTVVLGEGIDGQGYDFGERGRVAEAIRLVDFLSSTVDDGMIAASEVGTDNHWYCLAGDWQEFQYAHVALSADGSTVTVRARDTHGHNFKDVFDTSGSQQIHPLLESDTYKSLRISGNLTDITASSTTTNENAPTAEINADGAEEENLPIFEMGDAQTTEPFIPTAPTATADTPLPGESLQAPPTISQLHSVTGVLPPHSPTMGQAPEERLSETTLATETESSIPGSLAVDELMADSLSLDGMLKRV